MLAEKVRTILRIRYSPQSHTDIQCEIGVDEFVFLETYAHQNNTINSQLLLALLDAYAQMQHAFIKYLPIELAILRLFGNNNERVGN